ncbi:RDD family protein [Actinomadura craniellae]|uniref:RDD family protein n=1 Tax=Actinomadura craniellae TaxID=2231787 RepID=A0A365H5F7_9ACTN|nr:RDD family protein [Actinomadura craniellae]RAY14279.1 RDD family protein [Actinomadura craniellae]
MAELVTGEAVELDLRVARPASRTCALLLDLMFQSVILNIALYTVSMTALVADEAWTVGLSILSLVAVTVGYPAAFETLSRGRTLGKLALGLRVVSDDGGPERFRQALARALAAAIEIWMLMGAPALISSLFNRRGKRLGDLLAGTVVIQERVPSSVVFGPVAVMPPQLAGWARGLELSQVSDGLALSARQYLTRFWELIPEVRDTLGQRIADQVTAVISPPPPPGVRPEILLSAVLAERSRRESTRLYRIRERRGRLHEAPPAPVPAMAMAGPPPRPVPPAGPPAPPPPSPPGPGQPQFLPPAHYGAGPYAQTLPQQPPPGGWVGR